MSIRWEPLGGGLTGEEAYSGALYLGHVLYRKVDPAWVYSLGAVHTKYITSVPGHAEVASLEEGRAAMEKAWAEWCAHAGLVTKVASE
jgi:hypothetical protein